MSGRGRIVAFGCLALVALGGVGVGGAQVGMSAGEKVAAQESKLRAEIEQRLAAIERAQAAAAADREGLGKQVDTLSRVVQTTGSTITARGDAPIGERLNAVDVVVQVWASRSAAGNAITAARATLDAVLKAVRGAGIPAADIRVDWQHVQFERWANKPSYRAQANVHAIVRSLRRVDAVVAAATRNNRPGAAVEYILFDVDENRVALDEARKAAVADARETAAAYAASMGKKLGTVVTIAETAEAHGSYYDYESAEIEVEVTFALA